MSSLFGEELILGSFISKVMFLYLGFLHGQNINENNKLNIDYKILFIFIICLATIFISGDRSAFVLAVIGTLGYLILNLNFETILIIFIYDSGVPAYQKNQICKTDTLYYSIYLSKKVDNQHIINISIQLIKCIKKKNFGHGIKSFRVKCNLEK